MDNQNTKITAASNLQVADDEINLMDLLLVVAKHNRFIIKLTFAAAVLAVVISLLMPNIYTGKTVILPPQQSSSSTGMLVGQLGGLSGLAGGSLGIKNPSDLHVGMLKSRVLADAMIQRFNLQSLYEQKTITGTRDTLAGATTVTAGKNGFITIEFSDKDPQLAASVANAYVEELDRLNQKLAVTEASRRRLFFENQLKGAKDDLASAEIALKETQEKTGLVQFDKQSGAIFEAVGNLRAQVAAKEVELNAMRTFATEQNPDYRQLREVLLGLRNQLAKVEQNNISSKSDAAVSTGKLPEAGLEYMRKMRDLKYQETIFELLTKQFEIAKIDEAKDAAIIQVVDKALVPEFKSKPKRVTITLLTITVAFFIGILLSLFREATERAKNNPKSLQHMNLLRRYLRKGS